MFNVVGEQFAAATKVIQEQTNRIASDLNSNCDGVNVAQANFNTAMEGVAALRARADEIEAEARITARAKRDEADNLHAAAIRALDTALTNSRAVQVSIVNQLVDGRMVTGGDQVGGKRRPKLVAGAGEGGGH